MSSYFDSYFLIIINFQARSATIYSKELYVTCVYVRGTRIWLLGFFEGKSGRTAAAVEKMIEKNQRGRLKLSAQKERIEQ